MVISRLFPVIFLITTRVPFHIWGGFNRSMDFARCTKMVCEGQEHQGLKSLRYGGKERYRPIWFSFVGWFCFKVVRTDWGTSASLFSRMDVETIAFPMTPGTTCAEKSSFTMMFDRLHRRQVTSRFILSTEECNILNLITFITFYSFYNKFWNNTPHVWIHTYKVCVGCIKLIQ